MSDVELVTGDTAPTLFGTITKKNEDGSYSVRDLSDVASIKFQMRKGDDKRYQVDAAAAIVTTSAGTVSYNWQVGDLSIPGTYQCQWELTLVDGKIQTSTPANTITVRRQ